MASAPITYQADSETAASHGFARIARKLSSFSRAPKAYGIWHDIRVLENLARKHADAAAEPWSLLAWFAGIASRSARAITEEIRIRRDTRKLMLMSDHMLKDIGLTRADIDRAVRYGRD